MRTAFVIAAHNEADLIADTVGQLAGRGNDVYVIADNCTDATATLAAEAGARVFERRDTARPGKGPALTWFVHTAAAELARLDALVVLDADSRVSGSFVAALAACFAHGARAAQAFVCPVGGHRSPASGLAAYSELLSQLIGDRLRAALGWTVPLRGTGMAFAPALLAELVGGLRTQVEDIEMSLRLAERGVRVHFMPQALVYDPKPPNASRVSRQRARWLHGQAQVWHSYRRTILRLALTRGPEAWALIWALLIKPKTLVMAANLLALLFLALIAFPPAWLHTLLLAGASLLLAADAVYFLAGLFLVPERGLYARALLWAPLYLALWLRSLALTRFSRTVWLRARE